MFIVRADMNNFIATGHVMRCLSIADAAKVAGHNVIFVSADDNSYDLITSRGFECHILDTKWDDMESEIDQFTSLCETVKVGSKDIILIDSYYVTHKYFENIKELGARVWYIDDLHKEDWPVDGVICYSNYYEDIGYGDTFVGRGLWGTKYAPLRQEFSECDDKKIVRQVSNLLILSGGSDPYDVIDNILSRIEICDYDCINAVCGVYNDRYEVLLKRYAKYSQVNIIKSVNKLIDYMKQADLTISAAGSTLFELCAIGTPTICYTLADNQIRGGEKFGEDEIMVYAGDVRSEGVFDVIAKQLVCLSEDYNYRLAMSRKMRLLVDGCGAERIVNELML